MNTLPQRSKLEQQLGWIILVILLLGCFLVVRPFVSSLLWGLVLSVSSWPLYRRVVKVLGGRKTLAAALMALGMICVIMIPFVIVGATLGENVNELAGATRRLLDEGPPAPPKWLHDLPLIGEQAAEHWQNLASDSSKLMQIGKRLVEITSGFILTVGLGLGRGLMEMALSILIAFLLFRGDGAFGKRVTSVVDRIAGTRGTHLMDVAASTIRGVVYGILGTALAQAVLAGVGFWIAGVPGAGVLALLTFFLSVVPVGPPLVWIPASLWLFHQGSSGWGVFMLIWGVGVSSVDNVIKPWIISQGSAMPFLLIFFGVIGGAVTFGFIGVFIGPTLLAVGYKLVAEWAANSGNVVPADAAAQKQ